MQGADMIRWFAALGIWGWVACVSEGRRSSDATAPQDVADVVQDGGDGDGVDDEATVPEDGVSVDDGVVTTEVGVEEVGEETGVSDASGTSCDRSSDCREPLGACSVWECIAHVCEAQPLDSGPCDDGDLCTGPGHCAIGTCEKGVTLTCESPSACARPTCDPLSGCGTEVVVDGFCDAGGGAWGTCSGVRMTPPDRCGEDGGCVDTDNDPARPLPKELALGDWFVLVQATQPSALETIAGDATFNADAHWTGSFESPAGLFDIEGNNGTWCLDTDGGVAFDIGLDHFVGQVDPAGEHFAGRGSIGHEVAMAVRPTGNIIDFDGPYFALVSLPDENGQLMTWTGTFTATLGCLDDDALLVGGADREPIYVSSADVCFSSSGNDRVHATLPVESGDGIATTLAVSGAIGPRGEVALFYRRVSEQLSFGSVVLVRLAGSSAEHFRGPSRWVVVMQEQNRPSVYRDAQGALTFSDDALVNGVVSGDAVLGRNIAFDDYGRFVMTLETANAIRSLSGYISTEGGFGILYEVEAPSTWLSLFDVTEAPAWPMLGFIVRHP